MQKFEMPMMEVEEFEIVDVIMTSGGGYNPNCPNEILGDCPDDFQ